MRRHGIILLVALGLACSSLAVGQQAETMVAFGDSTTARRAGVVVYATLLEQAFEVSGESYAVVNAGVPGNTTADALVRFKSDVRDHDPDIVIMQFGINDAAIDVWKDPPATEPRVSRESFRSNLTKMIRTLRADGVDVVLMTPNSKRWTPRMREKYGKPPYDPTSEHGYNVILEQYSEIVREVARTTGVKLIDIYQAFEQAEDTSALLLDGIHPNNSGHELVAEKILKVLRR